MIAQSLWRWPHRPVIHRVVPLYPDLTSASPATIARELEVLPLTELMRRAKAATLPHHGAVVTHSRKLFIPPPRQRTTLYKTVAAESAATMGAYDV